MAGATVAIEPGDELPRPGVAADEWVFAAWTADGRVGCVSGHRLLGRTAWYWSALVQEGRPLLHLTEWDVRVRADPFVVKAHELWAEHHCVAPMEQWSVGNEGYFAALDDPAEALARGYGVPTAVSFDLEWYAAAAPNPVGAGDGQAGYEQAGVVHGRIELQDRPPLELVEVPARRWRRWQDAAAPPGAVSPTPVPLGPVPLPEVVAHTGQRAPFAFPDGTVSDWVLSPRGWRSRARRRGPRR